MNIEIEDRGQERELVRCSWCDQIDDEEKVYASPGDDIENPKAYHKDCFESLRMFSMLILSEPDKSLEQLVKMANRFSGNKRMEKMKRKKK